ncbi:MAG: hypothetical protein JRE56_07685 [Deltaproteobacteria bacterium]|nr:hypothetical protein [Deltaproteobacteria bacterium]
MDGTSSRRRGIEIGTCRLGGGDDQGGRIERRGIRTRKRHTGERPGAVKGQPQRDLARIDILDL